MKLTRRQVLKAGAATTAALAMPAIAQSREPLIVAGYGGEFGEIYRKTVVEPFARDMGVKTVFADAGLATAQLAKLRAGRGDGGFDVGAEFTAEATIIASKENLLARMTPAEVPNLEHTWPQVRKQFPAYGALRGLISAVLMYNKEKMEAPKSWLDYWEAEKRYGANIRGRVGAHGLQNYSLLLFPLVMGAVATGGNERDLNRAFEMLKALKPSLGPVLQSSAAAVPYMENQQLWLLPYWSSRAAYYIDRGFPYAIANLKEGAVAHPLITVVPAGSKNKELAYKFVNYTLEKEVQKALCVDFHTGPARGDITNWPAGFADKQLVTAAQIATAYFPDVEYLAGQRKRITETWQDIMA